MAEWSTMVVTQLDEAIRARRAPGIVVAIGEEDAGFGAYHVNFLTK
ncbi:MAG: hypothetical protein ACLFRX_08550 [Gemmatimonadota bacterium]